MAKVIGEYCGNGKSVTNGEEREEKTQNKREKDVYKHLDARK